MLAAKPHLDRWLDRNDTHGEEIAGELSAAGFISDKRCSSMVAQWAYAATATSGGIVWVREKITEPITHECLSSFA